MRFVDLFTRPWIDVPTVWIDTETTGKQPGVDKAVQVGLVRFEKGVPVGSFVSLVRPGREISAEATVVHGFTDADVVDAPSIQSLFLTQPVQQLLRGAQPGAYNAPFDKHFVPPFGDDWTWPWLDALSLVRVVDRWAKGKGRHQLGVTAQRHGIPLAAAHDAGADAEAAGRLFYKLAASGSGWASTVSLGDVLRDQRVAEAEQWADFQGWLAKQPPQAALPGV
jgi:DNA polymerase III subunit epsilon